MRTKNFTKKTLIGLSLLTVMLAACCEAQPDKRKYIETERGLFSYALGYCQLGMLTTNDGRNILDENAKPITCKGYVLLTDEEAKRRGYGG